MIDHCTNEQPEMRWIPVVDDRGHTRMEARWIIPAAQADVTHAA